MPKPKRKGAGRGPRRPPKAKAGARARKPKAKKPKPKRPKARVAKRPPKKTVRAPAAPKAAAPKTATPRHAPVKKKEETRMAGQNCPIHNSPDCFKPALDAFIQKAYDGYCTKIDWPYWRIIPKGWKPGK